MPEDHIRLSVPADTRYARLARLTAASLAGRDGFTYDEVEDVRIAVSEACALLLGGPLTADDGLDDLGGLASGGFDEAGRPSPLDDPTFDGGDDPLDRLDVELTTGNGELAVVLRRPAHETPATTDLSEQILAAVLDSYEFSRDDRGGAVVRLVKRHASA